MAPLRKALRKLQILALVAALGLALPGPTAQAASGSWNGVSFTALNGVVQTAWNGTSISCASAYSPLTDTSVVEYLTADSPVYNTLTTQATNGQTAETWVAATGQNAIQLTGANKPTFNTNVQNSLPAIAFTNSASHYMTTVTFGTLSQAYSIWLVLKVTDISTTRPILDGLTGSNRASFWTQSTPDYRMSAGTIVNFGTSDTSTWHIIELKFNGASSYYSIDGAAPTTVSAGTNSFVGMVLGKFEDDTIQPGCIIGAVMIQNNTRTSTSADVYAFFKAKWGL